MNFRETYIAMLGLFFIFCSSIYADENKGFELSNCLTRYWGVDHYTAAFISKQCYPLIENEEYHVIIDDFIERSQKLQIDFSPNKIVTPLPDNDGIYQAPKQHTVIFESPYVRILAGATQPGEYEPLHIHTWKSIMVVIQGTKFEVEYADGMVEIMDIPIGVYDLPAGEHYSCTNIGTQPEKSFRFEVK